MLPQIKATISHKDNPNIDRLIENARNIEEGLKSLPVSDITNEYKERLISNENVVKTLCENMSKLLEKFSETNESVKEIQRGSRSRESEKVYHDRRREHSRDKSRDRYVNNSNNYHDDYDRQRSRDRPYYDNREQRRDISRDLYQARSDDRYNRDGKRDHSQERYSYNHKKPEYKGRQCSSDRDQSRERSGSYDRRGDKRNPKHVEFDIARKISDSRNLEGEPLCFHCNKPGHHIKFCPYLNVSKTPPVQRKSNFISQSENPFSSDSENDELIYQEVFINDKSISALIDCGSEVSLIESGKAKMLGLDLKPYTGREIKAVNESPVVIEGQTYAQVLLKSSEGNKIINVKLAAVKNFD